jgi:Fe-S-cluster-containing dehydrogenase component
MTAKMLVVDPDRCIGCGLCEMACSFHHTGEFSRTRSRIKAFRWEKTCDAVPLVCYQCEDAPCIKVCGVAGAIGRHKETGAVVINPDLCIGCRLCMFNCPYGAIDFDAVSGRLIKCDLCGGDPECVKYCSVKAITYTEPVKAGEFLKAMEASKLREQSKGPAAAAR